MQIDWSFSSKFWTWTGLSPEVVMFSWPQSGTSHCFRKSVNWQTCFIPFANFADFNTYNNGVGISFRINLFNQIYQDFIVISIFEREGYGEKKVKRLQMFQTLQSWKTRGRKTFGTINLGGSWIRLLTDAFGNQFLGVTELAHFVLVIYLRIPMLTVTQMVSLCLITTKPLSKN